MPDLSAVATFAGSFAVGSGPPTGIPASRPFGYFDKDARQFWIMSTGTFTWTQVGAATPTASLLTGTPSFFSTAILNSGNAAPGVTITSTPNTLAITNALGRAGYLRVWATCNFGTSSAAGGVNVTDFGLDFDPGTGSYIVGVDERRAAVEPGDSFGQRAGSTPSVYVDLTPYLTSPVLAAGGSVTLRAQVRHTQVSTLFSNWGAGGSSTASVLLRAFLVG